MKFVVALLLATALHEQEFRGAFSGIVTDAQGAAMPQVKIVIIETHTGNRSETITSATGEYTVSFLESHSAAVS